MGETPMWFECPVARRFYSADSGLQRVVRGTHHTARTGRTKPKPHRSDRRNTGHRTLGVYHEYRCSCGHVGWSSHVDVARLPLAPQPVQKVLESEGGPL
jgi:hypothetical protein